MRLAIVVSSLGGGGAERAVVTLSAELARRGKDVVVMTYADVPDVYALDAAVRRERLRPEVGAPVRWLDVIGQWRRVAELRRALAAATPDVVLGVMDGTNELVLVASRGLGVPVVVVCQSDPRAQAHASRRWEIARRLTYPLADRVVFLNEAQARWARGHFTRWRAEAIPNPVEVPPPGRDGTRVDPGWACTRTLVAMGRLSREKGFDLLVEAFARCAPARPDWGLLVLGEGPERAALEAQAARLGVADRIRLPGLANPPFATLRAADLFVMSSRYEGQGLALIEAMACGLGAVSFDCPSGPREIIRPGVDGVLVPPGDVHALAAALSDLMGDPARREAMGREAVDVVQRFGVGLIADRWMALFDACRT